MSSRFRCKPGLVTIRVGDEEIFINRRFEFTWKQAFKLAYYILIYRKVSTVVKMDEMDGETVLKYIRGSR